MPIKPKLLKIFAPLRETINTASQTSAIILAHAWQRARREEVGNITKRSVITSGASAIYSIKEAGGGEVFVQELPPLPLLSLLQIRDGCGFCSLELSALSP
jgi:hypothetical protein